MRSRETSAAGMYEGMALVSKGKQPGTAPGRSAKPTMSDVAQAAGVSLSSVSRVFLGQKKVSDKTRAKVLAVAEELGYTPNSSSHRRYCKDGRTIGLLLRDADNPAYGALFTGLHMAAERRGWEVTTMTVSKGKQDEHQIELLHRLLAMDVAGLIVATGDLPSELLEPFMARVPILRAGRPEPHNLIHAVALDAEEAGRELARLVVEAGHTRIAVVSTRPEISFPEHTRAVGAVEEIRRSGLEPFVVDVGFETGAEYILPLVQSGAATAVMCPTDRRQVEYINLFEHNGLTVPGDVSVTGCDGQLPGGDLMGLTTYRWPVRDMADLVVEQTIDIIERFGTPDSPRTPVNLVVKGEVIPGRTLGRVAAEPNASPRNPQMPGE